MKTVMVELPDEHAAALEKAVADCGFASPSEIVRAAIADFLTIPVDYDPDALARDVAEHKSEKSRGEGGYSPEAARGWLRDARSA